MQSSICFCSSGTSENCGGEAVDSVDFQVSLVAAPSIRIDVTGSDLSMALDAEDNWTPPQDLNSLPRPWREFLEPSPMATNFRFREDVLLVGTQAVRTGHYIHDHLASNFIFVLKLETEIPIIKLNCFSWSILIRHKNNEQTTSRTRGRRSCSVGSCSATAVVVSFCSHGRQTQRPWSGDVFFQQKKTQKNWFYLLLNKNWMWNFW